MIVEYIRYEVSPGDEQGLITAYEAASEHLRAAPECLAYELSQCEEAPQSFILRIEWESTEQHLRGFRTGLNFRPFLAAIRHLVPNITEMRHYAPNAVCWRRS
ncbi:MAG: antibiotic biosynthesis monooxygenase [Sphingosinicella sp.]|nr:antibiotic biosynthesis monooxygenase [Sphingosinicella sp.]